VFLDWKKYFHAHVHASSIALNVVLAQPWEGEIDHPISFASKKLSNIENNYMMTEREVLVMVYSLQKFIHFLLGSHFKMYIDHSALKYQVKKKMLGGRICRWLLLFQEYEFKVIVKPGKLKGGPYHLSWILTGEDAKNLDNSLQNVHLFIVQMVDDHFVEIFQYLSTWVAPSNMIVAQKKKLVVKEMDYQLIVGKLYKLGIDGILRWCVLEHERNMILVESYDGVAGGNYEGKVTMKNILCARIWWPTLHKETK